MRAWNIIIITANQQNFISTYLQHAKVPWITTLNHRMRVEYDRCDISLMPRRDTHWQYPQAKAPDRRKTNETPRTILRADVNEAGCFDYDVPQLQHIVCVELCCSMLSVLCVRVWVCAFKKKNASLEYVTVIYTFVQYLYVPSLLMQCILRWGLQ